MENVPSIIDSHCHLDRFAKKGILEETLANAEAAGVRRMIAIGTSVDDWGGYREMAAKYPGRVDYTVGLHPCDVEEGWEAQVAQLEGFFSATEGEVLPVGIGEIGLDYFHLPKKDEVRAAQLVELQQAALMEQLALVKRLACPVVIHSRGAFADSVKLIDESGVNWADVVFHCFSEGAEEIAQLNERGGRGSFTGIITFKNAQSVKNAALAQGLDKVMVETDAPYLAPMPHRGKPCEPAYTALTAQYCAELFGLPYEAFAAESLKNTEEFFRLKK